MRSMTLPVLPQRGDDVHRGDGRTFLPERPQSLGQLPPSYGEEFLRKGVIDGAAALPCGDERLEVPGDLVPDHEVQLPRGGRHRVISKYGVTTLPLYPTYSAATCQNATSRIRRGHERDRRYQDREGGCGAEPRNRRDVPGKSPKFRHQLPPVNIIGFR